MKTQKFDEWLNESRGLKIEKSKYYELPNNSSDFDNKFVELARVLSNDNHKIAKLMILPSGTLQISYDNGDYYKYEESNQALSAKIRVSGKLNNTPFSSGYISADYDENGPFMAFIGARKIKSMTDARLQEFYDTIINLEYN